jgi:O-antigen ligase
LTFGLLISVSSRLFYNSATCDFSILNLKQPIFLMFAGYLAVAAVSLTKTINFSEGLFEWLKLCLFLIFLCLSCIVIKGDKYRIRNLARVLVVLGTLLSAIGICQYFGLAFTSIPGNYVIYATMAHKNLLASALFLILPFVLYNIFGASGFWRMISLVAMTLIFVCIFFTKARIVWLAIIFAVLFVTMIWVAKNRKNTLRTGCHWLISKRNSALIGAALVLIAITIGFYNHNDQKISSIVNKKLFNTSRVGGVPDSFFHLDTLHERIWLWQKSWEMIKENPWLGVGLGQWRIHFPDYAKTRKFRKTDNDIREIVFQRPHNDYVWVLAESGFLGLIFFLAVLIFPIFYCFQMLSKTTDRNIKLLSICMLFGLIGYMIISFFSFPKERIVHGIFLSLIIACVVSTYHSAVPEQKRSSSPNLRVLSILSMLLLSMCAGIGYTRLQSEIHTRNAVLAHHSENWQTVVAEIDRANTMFYNIDPASTPLFWYRGVANYSMGRFNEAISDFKSAYRVHPYNYHVLNNLGTSYAKVGDYQRAGEYYQKAIDAFPGFQDALINLGLVSFQMGNIAEAKRFFLLGKQGKMQKQVSVFVHKGDENY